MNLDSIDDLEQPAIANKFRKKLQQYNIQESQVNEYEFSEDVVVKTVNLFYAKNNWILVGLEFLDHMPNTIIRIGSGNDKRMKTVDLKDN